ncbi:hypothetical protein B0T18DRAFT_439717 [Schizothecium vesticola]|uniref:Rhodopsin domain-containing protein n=1 Tax=Schizothecium vesticola TaxID=314040 RepID=A0AA40ERH2_9PEZI|nr:hypothetical protein B0T18DRAFT_439717 [Schizothecium vesticola]
MGAFVTEAFALLGVGLLFIGLRSYVRISTVGWKGLQADDYLMWFAAILYSGETALAYSVGAYWRGLANNGMTDEQRLLLDPNSEEFMLRVNGSKTQVAGWSTYTLLLWVVKAAMCTFYLRLTDGLEFKTRIYVGFGLIFSTWVAVFLSIMFSCIPFHKNWQIYPDPGNFCQPAISKIDIFVTVVLNVITDLYLMSIPIPMLWRASLPPAKKGGLILLFSGGLFVTMAGILRCVLIITDPINGAQQAGSWAVRETFVAVVTSNMPMVFPLVIRWGRPLIGTFRSISSTGNKNSKLSRSGDPHSGAFKLEDKNPRRGMGPRSVNPITEFTMSGIIMKQTTLQVTESRKSRSDFDGGGDDGGIGDYYLVQQGRKSGDVHGGRHDAGASSRKGKRSSMNFSAPRKI